MADTSLSILGASSLTANQIAAWYSGHGHGNGKLNVPYQDLIGYYVSEGNAQGVRGDVAFAQACEETAYFTNNDTALNNYAGIGHPQSAGAGLDFTSPQIGVRAHIQLLARVVSGNGVKLTNQPSSATPNWGGKNVSTWGGLSGNWAADMGAEILEAIVKSGETIRHPVMNGVTVGQLARMEQQLADLSTALGLPLRTV